MNDTAPSFGMTQLPRLAIALVAGGAVPLARGANVPTAAGLGLLAALLVGLMLMSLPGMRRGVEVIAAGMLLSAPFPVVTELWLALALVLSVFVYHLLYGGGARRLPLRFHLISRRDAIAALPVEHVWQRLVPGAGHPDDFWSGDLLDYDSDPDDPMTLYLRFRSGCGTFPEATVTFLEAEPGRRARWVQEDERAPEDELREVGLRLIAEEPFRTRIVSEVRLSNLTLGRALSLWLDDLSGDNWQGLARSRSRSRWVARDRAQGNRPVAT